MDPPVGGGLAGQARCRPQADGDDDEDFQPDTKRGRGPGGTCSDSKKESRGGGKAGGQGKKESRGGGMAGRQGEKESRGGGKVKMIKMIIIIIIFIIFTTILIQRNHFYHFYDDFNTFFPILLPSRVPRLGSDRMAPVLGPPLAFFLRRPIHTTGMKTTSFRSFLTEIRLRKFRNVAF
jgi:hypothetical protein